jgi:NADPH:quinone reductase
MVAADSAQVFAVPSGADLVAASAILTAYGTAYYALKDRAGLRSGETLLVLGAAGGVGLAAVELGVAMGATVLAAASSAERLALCREYGASQVVNYVETDLKAWVKEQTGGLGVDVVFDTVGGDASESAIRCMAWEGRFLVIGFAAGRIPAIRLNLPLLKGCSIVGVYHGAHNARHPKLRQALVTELLDMLGTGRLRPFISAQYPLAGAASALAALDGRGVLGKVAVVPPAAEL